jgi:hypothetical protein
MSTFFLEEFISGLYPANCHSLEMEGFECGYLVPDAGCLFFPQLIIFYDHAQSGGTHSHDSHGLTNVHFCNGL